MLKIRLHFSYTFFLNLWGNLLACHKSQGRRDGLMVSSLVTRSTGPSSSPSGDILSLHATNRRDKLRPDGPLDSYADYYLIILSLWCCFVLLSWLVSSCFYFSRCPMESHQWQCKFKSTTYIPYLFSFVSENQQFNVIKFGETHWKIIQITSEHASEYRLRTLQASSQFYYALKTGFSNLRYMVI